MTGSSVAWTLLPALLPLTSGTVCFLHGGIGSARQKPLIHPFLAGSDYPELATRLPGIPVSSRKGDGPPKELRPGVTGELFDVRSPTSDSALDRNATSSILWSPLNDSAMKTNNFDFQNISKPSSSSSNNSPLTASVPLKRDSTVLASVSGKRGPSRN